MPATEITEAGTNRPLYPDDIFGDGSARGWEQGPTREMYKPGVDGKPGTAEVLNAYDPGWSLDKWKSEPLSMWVPLPDEPVTCEDICKQEHKKADEKCAVARKRVELGLKKAGCPSKVLAVKRKTACGGSRKAPAPKPKAKAAAKKR
jgi:hypothetical protein